MKRPRKATARAVEAAEVPLVMSMPQLMLAGRFQSPARRESPRCYR